MNLFIKKIFINIYFLTLKKKSKKILIKQKKKKKTLLFNFY